MAEEAKYNYIKYTELDETLKSIRDSHDRVLFTFKGSVDPATGVNWCPDCVDAEGPIRGTVYPVANKLNIPVYEVNVGAKDE
jgi:WD40 repeat protein